LSEQRSPVAALGDDLLQRRGVIDTLKGAPPNDLFVTLGCMIDRQRMLVLLTIPGTSNASEPRGYIVAWVDLASLCRDRDLELIRDDVLATIPQATMQASSDMESFVPVSDGAATWVARIQRGAGFDKYGAPTPWLTFIAVGLSTLPLLLLASLAGRSARLSASLEAEREVLRQQRFFTQSVSHEFRTPLGIIQSGADLLDQYAEHLTPERRREVLDEIRDNTHQMTAMVEQVLFLGRMESGGTACQRKPMGLAVICEESAQRVTRATGGERRIVVRAPQREVMLDPLLIGSLLENVLGNAVKYSHPDKAVTLEVAADDERMTLVVRDEGMGIPASELPRVCDPFHRCGNVGAAPGTGLGLAIANRCAALHGGSLNIESVEGKGTTVTVTIPNTSAS
jgi:signal transduction histidine kinase